MPPLIRPATPDDIPAIHAMTQAAYAEYRSLLPYSSVWQETPAEIAAEMQLDPVLVFCLDNRFIGGVHCHPHETEKYGKFIYVHRLAVLPEYRRQKLGYRLMQSVEAIAQSMQLPTVRLEVRAAQPENKVFYSKLGYELGSVFTLKHC
jgi:ribosomal protein S18 acetylase RimI-like enzyme